MAAYQEKRSELSWQSTCKHCKHLKLHTHLCVKAFAEASCASQIRTARAVASEMGADVAALNGVQDWANLTEAHSETGVQRVVKKHKTQLAVPMTSVLAAGSDIPWIAPRDWFQFVMECGLWRMFAGLRVEQKHLEPQTWKKFWKQYQVLHPDFPLFSEEWSHVDPSRCVGVYIHGDEGRTLKKSGWMVVTMQSALGRGFDQKRLKRDVSGVLKPQVNFAGNTYTTRMVGFCMPKTIYDKVPAVFDEAMRIYGENLRDLLDHGLVHPDTKERHWVVCLGVKGDWPFLSKAGRFTRSFNTMAKQGKNEKEHGCCHLCLAGYKDYPAEELNSYNPAWCNTVGIVRPWMRTPPILKSQVTEVGCPEKFFYADVWHTVHLGVGKSFVASTIHLVLDVLPHSNLDLKWDFLTQHYVNWCRANKKQTHISKITKTLMCYNDRSGVKGAWHKGALTTNFMKWLMRLIPDVPADPEGLLVVCQVAVARLNGMFACFYQGGFFLDKAESLYAASCLLEFGGAYMKLAEAQFKVQRPYLFPLFPKLHSLNHCMVEMKRDVDAHGYSQNPMATSCQMDEDAIGKLSRLSRRVSIRKAMIRTLSRYLIGAKRAWEQAGLIR